MVLTAPLSSSTVKLSVVILMQTMIYEHHLPEQCMVKVSFPTFENLHGLRDGSLLNGLFSCCNTVTSVGTRLRDWARGADL